MPEQKITPLVMVTGYAQTGKDSLGELLIARHGFRLAKTSHAIKHVAWELNPLVGTDGTRLQDLIADPFNHEQTEAAKQTIYGDECVRIWQHLGTECVDNTALGSDLWARTVVRAVQAMMNAGHAVVLTDGRKHEEADAIRALGGMIIRVNRPGVGPRNSHANEVALDDYPFDLVITNDGTLEDLAAHADRLAAQLLPLALAHAATHAYFLPHGVIAPCAS